MCDNISLWNDTVSLPSFPDLKSDLKTDVLIIGGGISGILTTYFLKQNGVECVLVEKDRICSGVTSNTTAKITSQHGFIYSEILKNSGIETAKLYLEANNKALEKYKNIAQSIDCDFEITDNYVYSEDLEKIDKELFSLNKIGYKFEYVKDLNLPVRNVGGIKFSSQAQFHPLKFIKSIVKNLKIYENTFVKDAKENVAITDKYKIKANKIIIASHFPFINKHGSYFLKQYQHRSYVIGIKTKNLVDGMYVSDEKDGFSFRNYNDLLIIGGGGHRTGKNSGNYKVIEEFIKNNYPDSQIKYKWAAQDCISLDSIPYVGNYSKNTPNLYVISGFNKWGMSGSMVAAMLLKDKILEKDNDFFEVFSPSRSILRKQLFINGFESAINLINPIGRRCPHLGCALKWNKSEHSFDCPCHGSRFDKTGKIIDNPSNRDLII